VRGSRPVTPALKTKAKRRASWRQRTEATKAVYGLQCHFSSSSSFLQPISVIKTEP